MTGYGWRRTVVFGEFKVNDQPHPDIKQTPLHALHLKLGGKMVPFAGYEMPVQYPAGIMEEHLHTREAASVFDVSHMGQAFLHGEDAASALETLVPGDIQGLAPGRTRYTVFTNEDGGILDDLMVTNMGSHLFLVVNAACKDADFTHLESHIGDRAKLDILDDRALIALQGPKAAIVLGRFNADAPTMPFMSCGEMDLNSTSAFVTRSGYTGEDGFEISVAGKDAAELARQFLDEPDAEPAGLGARDTLRLEAGLCLYGSDLSQTTTPVEADLAWIINKRRRTEGGFPGADIILAQLKSGTDRRRVGIRPDGKAPARAHTIIENSEGNAVGEVTSGGYGPTIGGPIAMGYVKSAFSKPGTVVNLMVRGKAMLAQVVQLPFVEQRYYKP
ncbi:MAG: glycine cleavage system aminomethyltransferase GcvT [Rhodospirillales bacterium]|nr:glycine cleavage system aminomethyltransferase GcvT [Rhodospirillales bacterium]